MTGEMLFLLGINAFIGGVLFLSMLKNNMAVNVVVAFTGVVIIGMAHSYFEKISYDPYIKNLFVAIILPVSLGFLIRIMLEHWEHRKTLSND